MKKLLPVVALLLSTSAYAQTFPKLEGKPVIDQADILSPAQENDLNTKLFSYEKTSGHQLLVATVKSLEGNDIETYSLNFSRNLGIGSKETNDGIVLLVAPNEHKVRIEVGYGLEGYLTDGLSSNIIQQKILPAFKSGDFPGGINSGVDSIISVTTPSAMAKANEDARKEKIALAASSAEFTRFIETLGMVVGGVLTLGGVVWVALIPSRRKRKAEEEARRVAKIEALREQEAESQRRRTAYNQKVDAARRAQAIKDRAAYEKQQFLEAAAAKKAKREREKLLASMTPVALAAFLAAEAKKKAEQDELMRITRLKQQRADEAERVRIKKQNDEEEAERRARRSREDSYSSSSYSSSSDSYSSSSSDSFSGGGGSFGGGGSSGSW